MKQNAIFNKHFQKSIVLNLHVAASALAADVTTPKLVIDSIKPPYTMLFRISNFVSSLACVCPSSKIMIAVLGMVSTAAAYSPSSKLDHLSVTHRNNIQLQGIMPMLRERIITENCMHTFISLLCCKFTFNVGLNFRSFIRFWLLLWVLLICIINIRD